MSGGTRGDAGRDGRNAPLFGLEACAKNGVSSGTIWKRAPKSQVAGTFPTSRKNSSPRSRPAPLRAQDFAPFKRLAAIPSPARQTSRQEPSPVVGAVQAHACRSTLTRDSRSRTDRAKQHTAQHQPHCPDFCPYYPFSATFRAAAREIASPVSASGATGHRSAVHAAPAASRDALVREPRAELGQSSSTFPRIDPFRRDLGVFIVVTTYSDGREISLAKAAFLSAN